MKLVAICLFIFTASFSGSSLDARVRYGDRLGQLDPDDPAAYFELAEDIVDAGSSPADVDLAIRLFVLADHLNPVMFRRSSILAIQPLVNDPAVGRLLRANLRAATVHSSYMPRSGHWSTRDDVMVMNAVDALSAFRNGDEKRFRRLLESDGVVEIFEANSDRLPGDVDWMLRRMSQRQGEGGVLREDDQVATLELQAELLGSPSQPWSVVLRTDGGRPLTVIDPIPLSEIFGVSADRSRWIDGQWSQ